MKHTHRLLISVGIAVAFLAGIVGAGCKKAIHPESGASAGIVSSNSQNSKSRSPSDLARSELASSGKSGTPNLIPPGTTNSSSIPGNSVIPPAPVGPSCFVETFHHKATPGHSDEEACSHHKNLLKLSHAGNPAHMCVRVNGTPVKYERKGDEVMIGSIAGPKSKITVSYCVGKLTCPEVAKEPCTIPTDEFLEAIQGGSAADDGTPAAQWEGADSAQNNQLNAEVKKEISDIEGADSKDEGARGPASVSIFKDWVNEQDVTACAQKQAS
jgi:hypothetical protein